MNRRIFLIGFVGAVVLAVGCDEITTRTSPTTLRVVLSVKGESSTFITAGDTLVNDTVVFKARVFEGEREVPIDSLTFTSSDTTVIKVITQPPDGFMLGPGEGLATFRSIGESTVIATILDPALEGTVDLSASLNVRVTSYALQFSLTSTVTGGSVSPANGLVGDTVRVEAEVTKDGVPVSSSGLSITGTSDANVIDPNAAQGPDRALLKADGTARLTVTLTEPRVPGNPTNLLRGTLDVTVKNFVVQLDAVSLVPGSTALFDGDTLLTDSVAFRATVIRAGNDTLKNFTSAGTRWTTSDPSVVRIVDDTIGIFADTGSAAVSALFDDLDLPGEFQDSIRVSTFVRQISMQSGYTAGVTDTLVTDSVKFSVAVTKDGLSRSSVVSGIGSSDSTVVSPLDATVAVDEAVFINTGQARVWTTLSEPRLPRRVLRDSIDLHVTTYVLTAESVSNPTPIMGDTIQYNISVRDTRGDTLLQTFSANFESSDPSVIRLLNAATGRALARDIGSAEMSVTLIDPDLPNGNVADTFAVTDIAAERFYGTFDVTTGDFGDPVILAASEVHAFTDSTKVVFPNGTVLFVDTVNVARDTMWAIVGAGTNTGQLTLSNLWANGTEDRDDVLSRITFTGQGAVADVFEPNDTFPLANADSFTVPGATGVFFQEHMSIDPAKADPIDNNFFWFTLSENVTLDITAEWQQGANVDFYVCSGVGVPPTGLLGTPCQLEAFDTSTTGPETGSVALGIGGPYVLRFWCRDNCPALPLTYKVTISRQ